MSDTTITILVVDDMKVMRELLCAILADDFQTMTAATGEECLGLVDDNPPDLVLLDVNMPGMNGHEICRELRQHAVMATIPIIFVSGAVSDEDRIAGFEVGGDDYITKPIDPELLYSTLAKYLLHAKPTSNISGRGDFIDHEANTQIQQLKNNTSLSVDEAIHKLQGKHALYLELISDFWNKYQSLASDLNHLFQGKGPLKTYH